MTENANRPQRSLRRRRAWIGHQPGSGPPSIDLPARGRAGSPSPSSRTGASRSSWSDRLSAVSSTPPVRLAPSLTWSWRFPSGVGRSTKSFGASTRGAGAWGAAVLGPHHLPHSDWKLGWRTLAPDRSDASCAIGQRLGHTRSHPARRPGYDGRAEHVGHARRFCPSEVRSGSEDALILEDSAPQGDTISKRSTMPMALLHSPERRRPRGEPRRRGPNGEWLHLQDHRLQSAGLGRDTIPPFGAGQIIGLGGMKPQEVDRGCSRTRTANVGRRTFELRTSAGLRWPGSGRPANRDIDADHPGIGYPVQRGLDGRAQERLIEPAVVVEDQGQPSGPSYTRLATRIGTQL